MKKAKFDDEELISLVEQNQCLWNLFLKNYRNKTVRHIAWQRISAILEVDIETVQKRWRLLRDRYKRELKGTYPRSKDNKPWELKPLMSFLDKTYGEEHQFEKANDTENDTEKSEPVIQPTTSQPVIQPFTSQPVIITVPRTKGPRPIAPKISVGESTFSKPIVSAIPRVVEVNSNSMSTNESEERIPKEPEIYLVTPTLFNDQERLLFNRSICTPTKRKANDDDSEEEDLEDSTSSRKAVLEESVMLRRQESERRLDWEEKEHLLRVKCQEEEHKVKMQIEQARLKVEEENLKVQEQKLKVLLAKEAYFKKLLEVKNSSDCNEESNDC